MQIQCNVIEVSVTLGDGVDSHCIEGYLPVTFDGKEALISAGSHILYDDPDWSSFPNIDCKKAPYFVTKSGQVIQQKPHITLVNITLTKLGTLLDDPQMKEIGKVDIFTNEGVYTAEQFHQFEDLIHFGRKRRMLQNKVIDNFCKDSSCLGTDRYNFNEYGTSPLGVGKSVIDWVRITLLEKLQVVGSYASILVVFLYAGQLVRCMYRQLDNLIHFRFGSRQTRKRRNSLHVEVENRVAHVVAPSRSEPEIMVMNELPAIKTISQKCGCQYCRGVKHDVNKRWPNSTCGFACCSYHLKRCMPFEWSLLDPENLAFDHKVEDDKYKGSIANTVSLRATCRCNVCLGLFRHASWRYVSSGCGCPRCENCNSIEIETRKSLGMDYDMIFDPKSRRVSTLQLE